MGWELEMRKSFPVSALDAGTSLSLEIFKLKTGVWGRSLARVGGRSRPGHSHFPAWPLSSLTSDPLLASAPTLVPQLPLYSLLSGQCLPIHFSFFLPQGEGEARVAGRGENQLLSQFWGGRGSPGRKDREGGVGGILEEEKAFLVPREKGALSEAVAQLGVCNLEVTHFKWPLCASLPWGQTGGSKAFSLLFGQPCSTPLPPLS